MRFTALTLIFLLFCPQLFSEYRVYQYYVKSTLTNIKDPNAKLVTSTLNPVSYVAYHGGSDVINVDLIRTWMCYGHTGKKDTCSPPDVDIKALLPVESTNENK